MDLAPSQHRQHIARAHTSPGVECMFVSAQNRESVKQVRTHVFDW
jgi:hypothetical protein